MKVLIVTGGIGSGKSTVCSMLSKDYGYPVYEADRRVKELYLEHPRLLTDIEKALGDTFRNEDGEFQPSRLASRIFSRKEDLLKVDPDSVLVYGEPYRLDNVDAVYTKPIRYYDLAKDIQGVVGLVNTITESTKK